MSETWLHEYILLAFRIHRLVQKAYQCPFVEAYYGPSEWRTQAESEPEFKASELVHLAMMLAEDRAAQMATHLKHPIWGRYELTYVNGQKLMMPWLHGPDRHGMFRRFLTQQFTPSQLEENTLPVQV